MHASDREDLSGALNKVPALTFSFWIIKVLSTTVGETAADFLAVEAGWGQGLTRGIMLLLLLGALSLQMRVRKHQPWIYWLTVVLVSIVGTQLTDLLTDRLGVSLYVSTGGFLAALGILFSLWFRAEGTLSVHSITTLRREGYYWAVILCAFALGTAAGDLATEALALGFGKGALIFGALLAVTYGVWRRGGPGVLCFWIGYILTRPFGAALGDLLTQARTYGGLGLGARWTSLIFLSLIAFWVVRAQRQAWSQARLSSQGVQSC